MKVFLCTNKTPAKIHRFPYLWSFAELVFLNSSIQTTISYLISSYFSGRSAAENTSSTLHHTRGQRHSANMLNNLSHSKRSKNTSNYWKVYHQFYTNIRRLFTPYRYYAYTMKNLHRNMSDDASTATKHAVIVPTGLHRPRPLQYTRTSERVP